MAVCVANKGVCEMTAWKCKRRVFKDTWIAQLSSDVNLQIMDGTIPGLYLRYYPISKKISFYLSCRIGFDHKRRNLMLGRWTEFINVAEVYKRAKDIREMILKSKVSAASSVLTSNEDIKTKEKRLIAGSKEKIFENAFGLYMEKYSALHKKPSTQKSNQLHYRLYIRPLFGRKYLDEIQERDLIDAYAQWAKNTSFSTANKVLSLVSNFWDWCESYGYLPRRSNPCGYVKKGHNPKYKPIVLNLEGYKKLFRSLELGPSKSRMHPRLFRVIKVLALTGCRCSEIRDLEMDEVSLPEKMIHLKDSKTGARDVMLADEAVKELEFAMKEAEILGSKYVFPGVYDKDKSVDNIRKPFEWALKDAGLPHMRIHDLRHSFITMGANIGENMTAMKDVAGHSRITTTEMYTHMAAEPAFKAVNHITQTICQ